MCKGRELNRWIHRQMNVGTVRKFKAVNGEAQKEDLALLV